LPMPKALQKPDRPRFRCMRCGREWLGRRYMAKPPKYCLWGHRWNLPRQRREKRPSSPVSGWYTDPANIDRASMVVPDVLELRAKDPKFWSLSRLAQKFDVSETLISRIIKGEAHAPRLCVCLRCGNRWLTHLPPPALPVSCPGKSRGGNGCNSWQWNTPRMSKAEWAKRVGEGQRRAIAKRLAQGLPPRRVSPWAGMTPEMRHARIAKSVATRKENQSASGSTRAPPTPRLRGYAPSRILKANPELAPPELPSEVEPQQTLESGGWSISKETASVRELALRIEMERRASRGLA
jgi:hypothetical protein